MKCVAIKGVKEFEIKDIEEPVSNKSDVIIDVKNVEYAVLISITGTWDNLLDW